MSYIYNIVLFLSKYVILKNYFELKLVQLNKFLFWMKVMGEVFFYYRKEAQGERCIVHLNSQAKGPLPDRTLESFLKNTEGVISNILEKSLR